MASDKQIEANRKHAKKSTGPRTEAGKARSARNTTRHGLASRQVVLADEDAGAYQELRMNLHEDLRPESQLEVLIVNRVAAQQWRLARVPALEAELLDRLRYDVLTEDQGLGGAWARDSGPHGGALARLSRYETALERSVSRLLEELRRVQRERRRLEQKALAPHAQEGHRAAAHDSREAGGHLPMRVDPTALGWPTPEGTDPVTVGPTRAAFPNEANRLTLPATGGLRAAPTPPAEMPLRNEANPTPLLRQRAPKNSALQAHVSGPAFREAAPALHRLSPTRRPPAKPNGRG